MITKRKADTDKAKVNLHLPDHLQDPAPWLCLFEPFRSRTARCSWMHWEVPVTASAKQESGTNQKGLKSKSKNCVKKSLKGSTQSFWDFEGGSRLQGFQGGLRELLSNWRLDSRRLQRELDEKWLDKFQYNTVANFTLKIPIQKVFVCMAFLRRLSSSFLQVALPGPKLPKEKAACNKTGITHEATQVAH